MAYAARGSQVPFTSINLEFTVPEFLLSPTRRVHATVGVQGDERLTLDPDALVEIIHQGVNINVFDALAYLSRPIASHSFGLPH